MGIINRAQITNSRRLYEEYGREFLSLTVMERYMIKQEIQDFLKKYNSFLLVRGTRNGKLPSEEEERLYERHLETGFPLTKLAKEVGMNSTKLRKIIYRVCYYRNIIRQEKTTS